MRAASIRFLLGRQPRLTHVPPRARDSVMTAVLPRGGLWGGAAAGRMRAARAARERRGGRVGGGWGGEMMTAPTPATRLRTACPIFNMRNSFSVGGRGFWIPEWIIER